ncbi:MAG: TlpA family protein disulfide reductase [Acidimicrobiia bacterium]
MSFQPSQPQRRPRSSLVLAVVSTVVVAIVAVVLLSRRGDDGDTSATSTTVAADPSTTATAPAITPSSLPPISNGGPEAVTAPVTVSGAALPALPASGADPAVGRAMPTFTGARVTDSAPLAITDDGRPKVIMFVAHWCEHCQKEVPRLTQYFAANGMPQTVDVYAVSTGVLPQQGNFPPAPWLKRENWPVPTLADDDKNAALTAAGLASFPGYVAVGADGTVKLRAAGELTTEQFETVLAAAEA